jgi:ubiquinone/menaquinone biosynthesis C-methylase UbiE
MKYWSTLFFKMAEVPQFAINYTQGHDAATLAAHNRRSASFSAAYLLPPIKPSDYILDIGWGPGSITLGLAEKAPDGQTVGIDYSPTVVGAGTKNAESRGGPKDCVFKTGNAYALEWNEETFDIIHARQCLIPHSRPRLGVN